MIEARQYFFQKISINIPSFTPQTLKNTKFLNPKWRLPVIRQNWWKFNFPTSVRMLAPPRTVG